MEPMLTVHVVKILVRAQVIQGRRFLAAVDRYAAERNWSREEALEHLSQPSTSAFVAGPSGIVPTDGGLRLSKNGQLAAIMLRGSRNARVRAWLNSRPQPLDPN